MPRKRKLTWQPGSGVRPGRWRKKVGGKTYYFPGGRGKTDQAAYEMAVDQWETLKQKLRAIAPKRHQADYECEINTWSRVLSWSQQHGDQSASELAIGRIKQLRAQLATPEPKPLAFGDTFEGYFDPNVRFPDYMSAVKMLREDFRRGMNSHLNEQQHSPVSATSALLINDPLETKETAAKAAHANLNADIPRLFGPSIAFVPPKEKPDIWETLRLEKGVWLDRLKVMQRSACAPEKCLAAHVDAFLIAKEQEAGANGVGMGRLYTLRLHLTDFAEWLGGDTPVDRIRGQDLLSYQSHLLNQVSEDKWSRTTASDRLSSIKTFVRWLWQIEAIANLPRVLDPRSKLLEIGKSVRQIVTFTETEISTLLANASDRTELYILLSLNTAMTQKDIADLVHEEVDWEQGRIIRQRSKTRRSRHVPTVNYKLWSETLELLLKHRSGATTGRVLLNEGGEPLLRERTSASGKYQKMDNVRNAFDRLRKKQKITKSFKSLKKTSASLLRGQAQYQSVVGLFLGHAPQNISDKFYAADPQRLLDDAITWLRGHYVEHKCFCSESVSQNGSGAAQFT